MADKKSQAVDGIVWQDKSSFELTITIANSTIKSKYQESLKEEAKSLDLPGFRKGKAPLNLVEEKLGKDVIYQKALEKTLPEAYSEAIKKHNLSPIIEPKISLVSAKKDEDWVFKAVSCILPEISLPDYQSEIKKINSKGKIWTPGKDSQKPTAEQEEKEKQERLQLILKKILEITKFEIPKLLVDAEVNKKLSSLVDQVQKAGMTIDQYLESKKTTIEKLKESYKNEIEESIKIELILEKIADQEKIQVEDKEIEKILEGAKEQKNNPQPNPYLLAQIIRRQKTLAQLLNL
jgi:FKBP-type peptidyl-prolyl cis-trans isomerase (trigger factor)